MSEDTVDTLQSRLGDYVLERGGTEYRFCCPFCIDRVGKEDDKNKLSVNPSKGKFHCWRCEIAGGVDLLFKMLGLLRSHGHSVTRSRRPVSEVDVEIKLPDDFVSISVDSPIGRVAREYLRLRGVFHSTQVRYGLGYGTGKMLGYVIFPTYMEGSLVGWTSRSFVNGVVPLHKHGLGRSKHILFGFDLAKRSEEVIVVEGPISAMMAYQHSGIESVGTLGKGVVPRGRDGSQGNPKVNALIGLECSKYLIPIESNAIWDTLATAWSLYRLDKKVKVSYMPEGQDTASMDRESVLKCIDSMISVNGLSEVMPLLEVLR